MLLSAPNTVWKKPFSNVWETSALWQLSFRLTWAADFTLSHLWSVGTSSMTFIKVTRGCCVTQTGDALSLKPRLWRVVVCSPAAEECVGLLTGFSLPHGWLQWPFHCPLQNDFRNAEWLVGAKLRCFYESERLGLLLSSCSTNVHLQVSTVWDNTCVCFELAEKLPGSYDSSELA